MAMMFPCKFQEYGYNLLKPRTQPQDNVGSSKEVDFVVGRGRKLLNGILIWCIISVTCPFQKK